MLCKLHAFSLVTVVMAAAFFVVGCGGDDDKGTGPGGGGGLVLSDGCGWIDSEDEGEGYFGGYIFRSDGVMIAFDCNEGIGCEGEEAAAWTTNGNKYTITYYDDDEPGTGTYSVSGNTLKFTYDGNTETLIKKCGIPEVLLR